MTEITASRLRAQRLVGDPFASAVEAVRWLGAVQAQDYPGAKWALAQRIMESTSAQLDRLIDSGLILRTHVMRPTWHFVLPEDIRWLLELTGPRVLAGVAGRHRELEIDGEVIARAEEAFGTELSGGSSLTRRELGEVLRRSGISPDGQRTAHLVMCAELDGLVVSGPWRGSEPTYALLAERAAKAQPMKRAEAIAELTRRYFQSHGPAQVQDFAWWSGLTLRDVRLGIELAGTELEHHRLDGKDYWVSSSTELVRESSSTVHLLPNYDEYLVAYRDRSAALHPDRPFRPDLFAFGSILSNVVTVGGMLHGAWRRTRAAGGLRVEVRLLDQMSRQEAAAVRKAVDRMSAFWEQPIELSYDQ